MIHTHILNDVQIVTCSIVFYSTCKRNFSIPVRVLTSSHIPDGSNGGNTRFHLPGVDSQRTGIESQQHFFDVLQNGS